MNNGSTRWLICSVIFLTLASEALAQWQIGAAKRDVTPTEPVLLTGYGSRTKPSEGIETKLWARALAIGADQPFLVIAVDNCGVPADMTQRVYERVNRLCAMPRRNFVICSTHTHNAPTLPGFAPGIWAERCSEADWDTVQRYAKTLEDNLVALAEETWTRRQDGTLAWAQGRVTFGGNRRLLKAGSWQNFGFQYDGPVDHSLPLLVGRDATGKIIAIWTNYACHCTTLGAKNTVGGDWAGFANDEIEQLFEGAVSLTTIGCGADVGPQPTGTLEFARQHGNEIAQEVQRLVAAGSLQRLSERITAESATVQLPYATVHDESYWRERAALKGFEGVHGRQMLQQLQQRGSLDPYLNYDITTWQFGRELAIVFLPGEVCVDYAVRLKTENDWRRIWINGWSNDVPCYIPSRRILREGGYEPDFSMIYYCRPSRFGDAVEDQLVAAVNALLGDRFEAPPERREAGMFVHPSPESIVFQSVREHFKAMDAQQQALLRRVQALAPAAINGFAGLLQSDFEESAWYDYLGRTSAPRPIVRQARTGQQTVWKTEEMSVNDRAPANGQEDLVVCFSGGVGWLSQPVTSGFQLTVADKIAVPFDITRQASSWKSAGGEAELLYLPTWVSAEDSAGFFLLVIHDPSLVGNQPASLTISVKSMGDDSQRWFAVDNNGEAANVLRKLLPEIVN